VPASTVMSFVPIEAQVMSHQVTANLGGVIDNRNSQDGGYWYDDLKQAYEYPSYETKVTVNGKSQRLDGTGATIGVLMSSDYLPSDVAAVFDHENWKQTTGKPNPTLYADIPINGGGGLYGGAFAEVSIDTQSEITGAPGAHVILYDIPDLSDGSIFAGYVDAIEDNEVDALSASFGECELYYFPSYNGGQDYRGILKAEDELFMQGNSQGITFLASSADMQAARMGLHRQPARLQGRDHLTHRRRIGAELSSELRRGQPMMVLRIGRIVQGREQLLKLVHITQRQRDFEARLACRIWRADERHSSRDGRGNIRRLGPEYKQQRQGCADQGEFSCNGVLDQVRSPLGLNIIRRALVGAQLGWLLALKLYCGRRYARS